VVAVLPGIPRVNDVVTAEAEVEVVPDSGLLTIEGKLGNSGSSAQTI